MLSFKHCKSTTHARIFSTTAVYKVLKGSLGSRENIRATVLPDDSPEGVVSAVVHPRGLDCSIPNGATVFLSRPMVSNPELDTYELIAFAFTGSDSKLSFTKFACIHPERNIEKLCKNCPRRDPE